MCNCVKKHILDLLVVNEVRRLEGLGRVADGGGVDVDVAVRPGLELVVLKRRNRLGMPQVRARARFRTHLRGGRAGHCAGGGLLVAELGREDLGEENDKKKHFFDDPGSGITKHRPNLKGISKFQSVFFLFFTQKPAKEQEVLNDFEFLTFKFDLISHDKKKYKLQEFIEIHLHNVRV